MKKKQKRCNQRTNWFSLAQLFRVVPNLSLKASPTFVNLIFFFLLVGVTFSSLSADSTSLKGSLTGAGATFPYPIYSKWISEFQKIEPGVQINYQSIGSGGGIRQFIEKTVDFGASDAPMSEKDIEKVNKQVIHIPTVLGAVVLTFFLPEIENSLKTQQNFQLTGELVAEIFLGKIVKWNDPKIQQINPGIKLPSSDIAVVHRSDGSGTSAIFTDYLSKVSPEWKEKVGSGTSVKWPNGLGGKGNEGVSGLVKQTPGAIGYVELIYAKSNALPVSALKNKAGNFVTPSLKSVTAAAAAFSKSIPEDFRISITDAEGKDSYPMSALTYLLVSPQLSSEKGPSLIAFLKWALSEGQNLADPLSYAPLPKDFAAKVKDKINTITIK